MTLGLIGAGHMGSHIDTFGNAARERALKVILHERKEDCDERY
jgi:hypothetical protein